MNKLNLRKNVRSKNLLISNGDNSKYMDCLWSQTHFSFGRDLFAYRICPIEIKTTSLKALFSIFTLSIRSQIAY